MLDTFFAFLLAAIRKTGIESVFPTKQSLLALSAVALAASSVIFLDAVWGFQWLELAALPPCKRNGRPRGGSSESNPE